MAASDRHETVVLYKNRGPRKFRFPVMNGVGPKTDLVDATWWLYRFGDPANPVITKVLGAGSVEIPSPATDGIIRLTIAAADIAAVTDGPYEGMMTAVDAVGVDAVVSVGTWIIQDSPA